MHLVTDCCALSVLLNMAPEVTESGKISASRVCCNLLHLLPACASKSIYTTITDNECVCSSGEINKQHDADLQKFEQNNLLPQVPPLSIMHFYNRGFTQWWDTHSTNFHTSSCTTLKSSCSVKMSLWNVVHVRVRPLSSAPSSHRPNAPLKK